MILDLQLLPKEPLFVHNFFIHLILLRQECKVTHYFEFLKQVMMVIHQEI